MDHWKKCHQFILICGSTPSNQCQPSPPAWLRSDAVKSAIENDLRQHKKSLAKQRDTMQVLVDSQNIQDGYRVRVFSDCCSILLGKCHLRIFNSKLYFDFLCRITQIDPFFPYATFPRKPPWRMRRTKPTKCWKSTKISWLEAISSDCLHFESLGLASCCYQPDLYYFNLIYI